MKKARFAFEEDALRAARRSRILLLLYRCDRCRKFHLTSRTRGKFLARPASGCLAASRSAQGEDKSGWT